MRLAPPMPVPRTRLRAAALAAVGALTTVACATAEPVSAAAVRAPNVPVPRIDLPTATAHGARVDAGRDARWLVGVDGDLGRAAALVRAAHGRFDPALGLAKLPRGSAPAFVRRMGHAVRWAGPDRRATEASSFDRPGTPPSPWARDLAGAPSLTPLPGTLAPIGIVDDAVDRSIAELAAVSVVNGAAPPARPEEIHGSMVASMAAAPYDGTGVVGVAPGAQVLSWGSNLACGDVASGIVSLAREGARIINMSLTFAPADACFALWQATAYAYTRGTTIVAASGNDAMKGNVSGYPASYPHVVTVGAIGQSLAPARFSTHDPQVDLAAPGVKVPVDIPVQFDTRDGLADGLSQVDGTSFAAPYVAGGLSWVLGARPDLDPGQVAGIVRSSSRDLWTPGWDERTGFGLIQVAAAMSTPAPAPDPGEPNDDPAFVRRSGPFDQSTVWSGRARATVVAVGDSADDPVDAYRIKVPAHDLAQVRLQTVSGRTDLFAFDGTVRDFGGRPLLSSTRPGTATETLTLRNSGHSARDALIVVNSVDDGMRAASSYALTIGRG